MASGADLAMLLIVLSLIGRMQKALEVDPKVRPLWYIAARFYAWQYLEVVSM